MKAKIVNLLPSLIVLFLISGCSNYTGNYSGYGNGNHKFGVTVWTNSDNAINVFINGKQAGQLTQKLDVAPECGAAGCVYYDTEDGGIKITIRGESVDGKVIWGEKSMRLNRDCRMVQFIKTSEGVPEILMN